MQTPSTRGFRLGRLRLAPVRSSRSTDLDPRGGRDASDSRPAALSPAEERRAERVGGVPFESWPTFTADFSETFDQGEHVTLLGRTGSGKTTLAVELVLPLRRFVIVFATKVKDDSLYPRLARQGYRQVESWGEIDAAEHDRWILKPPLRDASMSSRSGQREAFREALSGVFVEGGWCVFVDELRYLSDTLKLDGELETLYLQGRSLGVTMVAGTQRPRNIPLEVINQSTHVFAWLLSDRADVIRAGEMFGQLSEAARASIPRLPPHEALYCDISSGRIVRTKAPRPT